jgi:hypothetical protein
MVLTIYKIYAYYSIVNYEIILNHLGCVRQGYGRVNCPDDGLRILARIIARDLLAKRQDNANKKTGRKVGAHKHWRVAGEGLS